MDLDGCQLKAHTDSYCVRYQVKVFLPFILHSLFFIVGVQLKIRCIIFPGYSISSGNIFAKDKLAIVGGAPRANMLSGNVLLYQVTNGPFERLKEITDPSLRVCVCACFPSLLISIYIDFIVSTPFLLRGLLTSLQK